MNLSRSISQNGNNKKSRFTAEEDKKLVSIVFSFGVKDWNLISSLMTNRNSRQCKERWELFLSPNFSRDPWTKEEDEILLLKQKQIGNRWTLISRSFSRRSSVAVRNRWIFLQKCHENENEAQVNAPQRNDESNRQFNINFNEFDFHFDNDEFPFNFE
jgi:hypothetical protein